MSPHPLEALRYISRSWQAGDDFPAQEAASVLADLAGENPASLLQACRRLIEHFPASGTVWWLSARALAAPDPVGGIWEAARELADDPTTRHLAQALPSGTRLALAGRGGYRAAPAGKRQGASRDEKLSGDDLVVLRALAATPGQVLVSRRAARAAQGAAAKKATKATGQVWAVVERGALLPLPLWRQLLARVGGTVQADVVEAGDLTACICDAGKLPPGEALSSPTCAPVAELLGWKG
ncbi:MAG TPA: hypothetical protein VME20_13035 [Acidimicrobiales bacterium]|nr:hypothetical protein [Acidimicrobiales bacterium]